MPLDQPRDNIRPMHRARAGAPPPCKFPDEPFTRADASRSANDGREARAAVRAMLAEAAEPAPRPSRIAVPRRRAAVGRFVALAAVAVVLFIGLGLPLLAVLTGGQP